MAMFRVTEPHRKFTETYAALAGWPDCIRKYEMPASDSAKTAATHKEQHWGLPFIRWEFNTDQK